jgi:hypothetical protein
MVKLPKFKEAKQPRKKSWELGSGSDEHRDKDGDEVESGPTAKVTKRKRFAVKLSEALPTRTHAVPLASNLQSLHREEVNQRCKPLLPAHIYYCERLTVKETLVPAYNEYRRWLLADPATHEGLLIRGRCWTVRFPVKRDSYCRKARDDSLQQLFAIDQTAYHTKFN